MIHRPACLRALCWSNTNAAAESSQSARLLWTLSSSTQTWLLVFFQEASVTHLLRGCFQSNFRLLHTVEDSPVKGGAEGCCETALSPINCRTTADLLMKIHIAHFQFVTQHDVSGIQNASILMSCITTQSCSVRERGASTQSQCRHTHPEAGSMK